MEDKERSTVTENFLETQVVNEIIQNIEQLDLKCKNSTGDEAVDLRIRALAYSKILYNVYSKDITFLIKGYTNLAIAYIEIEYFEQAQEHLIQAFKLNENINDDVSITNKEYQIKILINLAKCYMENDKLTAGLAICQKSLKMNQTLLGEDHVSNADIYYVLSKINTKLKNYKTSIDNLSSMFEIYEKIYGFDSDKSAKICMELAQIYELQGDYPNAIEYFKNSYNVWEKIIKDPTHNEIFITLSMKIAELLEKSENYQHAYELLKNVFKYFKKFRLKKGMEIPLETLKRKKLILRNC